ncbi:MAG: S24 family peptidase, partial [Planctomycetota bacterium]
MNPNVLSDRRFSVHELTRLCPGLSLGTDRLGPGGIRGGGPERNITGPIPPGRAIPIINSVAAGYPYQFTDLDYPPSVADDYVHCPDVNDPHAFAARVVGDSMEPRYSEGDLVVF